MEQVRKNIQSFFSRCYPGRVRDRGMACPESATKPNRKQRLRAISRLNPERARSVEGEAGIKRLGGGFIKRLFRRKTRRTDRQAAKERPNHFAAFGEIRR